MWNMLFYNSVSKVDLNTYGTCAAALVFNLRQRVAGRTGLEFYPKVSE
jgi:hypothetical protein